jgi:hypothetical protein
MGSDAPSSKKSQKRRAIADGTFVADMSSYTAVLGDGSAATPHKIRKKDKKSPFAQDLSSHDVGTEASAPAGDGDKKSKKERKKKKGAAETDFQTPLDAAPLAEVPVGEVTKKEGNKSAEHEEAPEPADATQAGAEEKRKKKRKRDKEGVDTVNGDNTTVARKKHKKRSSAAADPVMISPDGDELLSEQAMKGVSEFTCGNASVEFSSTLIRVFALSRSSVMEVQQTSSRLVSPERVVRVSGRMIQTRSLQLVESVRTRQIPEKYTPLVAYYLSTIQSNLRTVCRCLRFHRYLSLWNSNAEISQRMQGTKCF